MVKLLDEHERTMAFAEVAFGQIKSLRQTAVPRNYEIWYVYATGYNASLNKIINETLARNGRLSEVRSRTDLRNLSFPHQGLRSHRQGWRARDRRNRRRDDPDHGCARHVAELRRQAERCEREAQERQKPRTDQGGRRRPGEVDPQDAGDQQGAGKPAVAVEDRDQQSPAQPRGDPRREPDRSADRIGQPQIFRPLVSTWRCGRRWRAASRCRY